ncbi:hypothetical protein LVJ82_16590 [Vitreoscilla massiliensis]|uniref:Uncharacterized protein n=1 Tax=Vitreoscilla massiliensis TaxID=1689272 RepID=A0ABY4E0G7_9NEIS|nr:hypothetical protein [Vitreoscilla massiliensis]UOO89042.1 hypothetical protein LVJ82_16590 [Vitreoscilla massiliensis]
MALQAASKNHIRLLKTWAEHEAVDMHSCLLDVAVYGAQTDEASMQMADASLYGNVVPIDKDGGVTLTAAACKRYGTYRPLL